ncbi:MAG TPA: hypothetical protein PKC59_05275 [Burkholderiaceae bacterium]|nr:hypothetical protein [Burkholderiaceae bacterium]HMX12179.1 hypothetical protein [Burkholderiaceae bacterium]HMZ00470.1 hypothetical protein [Burkholderiaceae bacterium]HNB42643.1 hypothetical protein [Burkholderiaceae bacterium]HNG79436.1 hypothetical protein [Burkholderiaceae bacterium]
MSARRTLPFGATAFAAAALLATAVSGTQAAELNNLNALSQSDFRLLAEDLGAALSYKALVPAETLGVIGFDIGVGGTGTTLKHRDVAAKAAGGSTIPATVPVTTLRAVKGLPFNIDIGAAVGTVPSTGLKVAGGELRWAILPGSALTPAIALRGALTRVSGNDQLKLDTRSVDLSISKGFLMVTPYAGIGVVQTDAQLKNTSAALAKDKESFTQQKVFVGANLNLGLVNLAVEGDKTGDATSYGVKFGFRF